jgi:zinc protease
MREKLILTPLLEAAALILTVALAGPAATAQTCEIPPYPREQTTLENGLRIVAVRTPSPNVVTLQITVHTRPASKEASSGLPHVFEHMLRRGTAAYPASRYDEVLRLANARQTAETADDRTTFQTVLTKDDLDRILEMEADRFQNFVLTERDFLDQASAIHAEYQRTAESPVFRLFETQRENAFTTHPYRHGKFGGRREGGNLLTQFNEAKAFFERWYRPENTTISLVGDVDPQSATKLVERFFGSWKQGSAAVRAEIPAEPEPKRRVVDHVWWKEPTPSWVTIAFHAPRFSDADFAAMDLLLEAYFGPGSDLYRRLVIEEEKVDLFGHDLPAAADPHLATIYARLNHPKDLVYVRDLILATVAEARERTPSAERLAAVKANRHYSLLSDIGTAHGTAAAIAPRLRLPDPFESLKDFGCERASLTPAGIQSVAARYFTDERLVITTLSHALRQLPLPEAPAIRAAGRGTSAPAPSSSSEPSISVQKTASPLLEAKLVFAAGSGRDPIGKEGLAALTARMIAQGHPISRSADETRDELYATGGSISVQVEKETATFTLRAHRDQWRSLLDAALPLILEPAFDRADFLALRDRQQKAFDRLVVDELNFSRELLQRRAFFATPYGHPATGSDDGLATATLRDVRRFFENHYTKGNLTVGVSGDVPDQIVPTLRQRLEPLRSGSSPALSVASYAPLGLMVDIFEDPGAEKTTLAVGFPIAVTRGHKDFAALALATMVFGDPRSVESRLHDRIVRSRDLASIASARIEQTPSVQQRINDPLVLRRASLFEVNLTSVDPKNANMALRTVLFELTKFIRDGVSEQEFMRARDILIKEIALAESDSSRWLGDELDERWYGGTGWAEIRQALSRLSRADVNKAIREHLQSRNVLAVLVTDGREQRLEMRKPSPPAISYREKKAKSLLDEDAVIAAMPLELEQEDVRFYTMQDLQEQGW